ncbi:MAG: hypothetical protein RLO01_13005 [Thalassobaculaceae bacterium]
MRSTANQQAKYYDFYALLAIFPALNFSGKRHLERSARAIPDHRRTPLLRIREAVDLVRLHGELVHADTLLLADLERTHSRVVGPVGTGLRALRALRALDDPHTPSLETALMHLDHDPSEWPAERDRDPRVLAIRSLIDDIIGILALDAPALARLLEARRLVLEADLPSPVLVGVEADPDHRTSGDDEVWLRQVESLNDSDPRRLLSAVAMAWAVREVGWTESPDLCVAAALREIPSPAAGGDGESLVWLAAVLSGAADRSRNRLVGVDQGIARLSAALSGPRDRARTRVVDALCCRPLTTAAELAAGAGISRKAAHDYLTRLAAAGLCHWRGARESGRVAIISGLIDA